MAAKKCARNSSRRAVHGVVDGADGVQGVVRVLGEVGGVGVLNIPAKMEVREGFSPSSLNPKYCRNLRPNTGVGGVGWGWGDGVGWCRR